MTFGVTFSLLLVHVSYCSYRDFITVSQILFLTFHLSKLGLGPRAQPSRVLPLREAQSRSTRIEIPLLQSSNLTISILRQNRRTASQATQQPQEAPPRLVSKLPFGTRVRVSRPPVVILSHVRARGPRVHQSQRPQRCAPPSTDLSICLPVFPVGRSHRIPEFGSVHVQTGSLVKGRIRSTMRTSPSSAWLQRLDRIVMQRLFRLTVLLYCIHVCSF